MHNPFLNLFTIKVINVNVNKVRNIGEEKSIDRSIRKAATVIMIFC